MNRIIVYALFFIIHIFTLIFLISFGTSFISLFHSYFNSMQRGWLFINYIYLFSFSFFLFSLIFFFFEKQLIRWSFFIKLLIVFFLVLFFYKSKNYLPLSYIFINFCGLLTVSVLHYIKIFSKLETSINP